MKMTDLINSQVVAEMLIYFFRKNGLTNQKLQKMLYYVQGFHLALHNKPMFLDPILAIPSGTIVKNVYEKYSIHGFDDIPCTRRFDLDLADEKINIVHDVFLIFKDYSSKEIEILIKNESPWIEARKNSTIYDIGKEINVLDIKKYFLTEYLTQKENHINE